MQITTQRIGAKLQIYIDSNPVGHPLKTIQQGLTVAEWLQSSIDATKIKNLIDSKGLEMQGLDKLKESVINVFKISMQEFEGRSRKQHIPMARQVFTLLAYNATKSTYSHIGRFMGNRHHTTILYQLTEAKKWLNLKDDTFMFYYNQLINNNLVNN